MRKNIIWPVLLVLVIIVAAIFIARHLGLFGRNVEIPDAALAVELEMIDRDTLVLMTKTLGEWEKLGKKDGKYLNPETNTYSMEGPILCGSCDKQIPPPDIPVEYKGEWPDDAAQRERIALEIVRIRAAYKCPKCGQPAVLHVY